MISDEQAVWVAERIRTFCANPAEPEYLRFHAEKNNVLPLLVVTDADRKALIAFLKTL